MILAMLFISLVSCGGWADLTQAEKSEFYWNNIDSTAPFRGGLRFDGNGDRIDTDLRWWFGNVNCAEIQEIVEPFLDMSIDNKMLGVQAWVKTKMTYVSDKEQFGGEYWADALETIQTLEGDCDDGAILMANLALAAGVPYWRVRLQSSVINSLDGTILGGHMYVTYLPDAEIEKDLTDQAWVVCDWGGNANLAPFEHRPYYKDDPLYIRNARLSWNQKRFFSRGPK